MTGLSRPAQAQTDHAVGAAARTLSASRASTTRRTASWFRAAPSVARTYIGIGRSRHNRGTMPRALRIFRPAVRHARWVLACFFTLILAANLSPLVRRLADAAPAGWSAICSGAGASPRSPAAGGSDAPPLAHTLDCPLCMGPALGRALAFMGHAQAARAGEPALVATAAPAAPQSRAAMPPRGPPAAIVAHGHPYLSVGSPAAGDFLARQPG